jgi:hypothetical protein
MINRSAAALLADSGDHHALTFGIDEDRQRIGDVVVITQVMAYEPAWVSARGVLVLPVERLASYEPPPRRPYHGTPAVHG